MNYIPYEHEKLLRNICDDDGFIENVNQCIEYVVLMAERKQPVPKKVNAELANFSKAVANLSPEAICHMAEPGHEQKLVDILAGCYNRANVPFKNDIQYKIQQRNLVFSHLTFFSETYGINATKYFEGNFTDFAHILIDVIKETVPVNYDAHQLVRDSIDTFTKYHSGEQG